MTPTRLLHPISGRGFGLVELMVSIGIIALITTMVMVRHSSFNSAVLEENQAYEVAFDIRQTQTRAVSPQAGINQNFRSGYGIRFINERSYEIYAFTDSTQTVVERRQLDPRFTFEVAHRTSTDSLESLDLEDRPAIQFARPDFDAQFINNEGAILGSAMIINVRMTDNGNNTGRDIVVSRAGQINIEKAPPNAE